ncbi:hypothetical protein K438DRAFT_1982123 [Mycena galopus ATCC 62051]|nr:hypothetical protein K438DRAFT_1982123 [Mycena galopus ATCC 62051]
MPPSITIDGTWGGSPVDSYRGVALKSDTGNEVRVVLLEKGSEAYILSRAVIEPSAGRAPPWVVHDGPRPSFSAAGDELGDALAHAEYWIPIPHPPQMNNRGNFIGVEPDAEDTQGSAVTCQHTKGASSQAFRTHGSLSKQAVAMYDLRRGKQAQTYGIGVKEVWRIEEGKHVPGVLSFPPSLLFSLFCFFIQPPAGKVLHTLGGLLSAHTSGGGWEYHMADSHVSIGLVVGLAYKNPTSGHIRTKHHPHFRALLVNGTLLAYGAHALTEARLPGRALVRCAGAAVNTVKIKGTHNTMQMHARLSPAFYPSHPPSAFLPFIVPPFYPLFL